MSLSGDILPPFLVLRPLLSLFFSIYIYTYISPPPLFLTTKFYFYFFATLGLVITIIIRSNEFSQDSRCRGLSNTRSPYMRIHIYIYIPSIFLFPYRWTLRQNERRMKDKIVRRDSVRTSHYPCLSDGIRPKEDASEDSTTINTEHLSIGDRTLTTPDRCVTFLCIVVEAESEWIKNARREGRVSPCFLPTLLLLLSIHAYTFNRE